MMEFYSKYIDQNISFFDTKKGDNLGFFWGGVGFLGHSGARARGRRRAMGTTARLAPRKSRSALQTLPLKAQQMGEQAGPSLASSKGHT